MAMKLSVITRCLPEVISRLKDCFASLAMTLKPKIERKQNPYHLIHYHHKMTERQVRKNNTNYWEWEINNNGFKL